MTALSRTRAEIAAAWDTFVTAGEVGSSVRPDIRRSWQRARSAWNVDPGLTRCPSALAADDARARAESEEAARIASRVIADFAPRLAPGGHVIAYFDADAVLLCVDGNAASRRRLEDVNFAPGACWAEHLAGTNGPGTALAEGRAVEVWASEHFVEAWQPWSCASVPVWSGGRVVGAIDITSPWTAREPSLLLTAEAIAQGIGARLAAEAADARSAILLQVAEDALRARDDFLTVASHELKTPLTPLRLKLQAAQRLLARGDAAAAGALERALAGADVHLGRAVKVVDELLDASRVVRAPLRPVPEPCDLAVTVRGVVARSAAELARSGCEVTVGGAPALPGVWDPALVARAVEHLLSNAVKHAPGRIELELEGDADAARLRVRDRGPGIAPGDEERIFLPFERAVSCENVAGFGLGLHAVRRIAEAHGGEVRVESRPGAGCTFVLELPRAAPAHAGA